MEYQIEQIENNSYDKMISMTTVIGIKCPEGIVLASDSLASSPMAKNSQVSKIFEINKSIGIGAAGDESQIKILVEEFTRYLGDEEFDSEPNLRNRINEILSYLHRTYSVEQSTRLGYQNTFLLFNPIALIGAKLSDGNFYLYQISFIPPSAYGPTHPSIALVDNYQAIGSGFPLANLVLTQQSRISKVLDKKLSELPLNLNVLNAIVVINEVKAVEPYTGGNTKIVVIDGDGYNEIPDKEQQEFYQNMIDITSIELSKLFSEKEGDIKNIFPKN